MPDTLDANGLTVKDAEEIRTKLETDMKAIYGDDINIAQNTQDGQQINITVQEGVDLRELLQKVYNSFDPDLAYGVVLDQRLAINNIKRKKGTFTFQNVEITTDRALNLVGLDGQSNELEPTVENLYSVKDDAGTIFYLLDSQTIVGAGTNSFNFRAKELGEVQTIPNTITTPDNVVAGVTNINNPSGANSIGVNGETDIQAKIRRRGSTLISAIGPIDALEARLNNLDLVTSARVYENDTDVTDANGIPPKGIWCIVEGGSDADIGNTIYAKRTEGTPTKGTETYVITRPAGDPYTAKFDRPIPQDLWIRFSIDLTGTGFIDEDGIKNLIVENVFWKIGADATSDVIYSYLKGLDPNYIITAVEVSDDGLAWSEVVAPTSIQHRFINDATRITII